MSTRNLESHISSLPWEEFEKFCLRFLMPGVLLSIERNGKITTKRIISTNIHGKRGPESDQGVDVIADVEGERWAFQCKHHKKWTKSDAEKAIKSAQGYSANHYFLWVGCSVDVASHELIRSHPDWTIWGIEDICAQFLNKVPHSHQRHVLGTNERHFKQIVPYANFSLVGYESFFGIDTSKVLRHTTPLVGREAEIKSLIRSASMQKVTLLVAKGGVGKSRLLYELAKYHREKQESINVVFFNPHADLSSLDANFDDEIERIVVIDDAHRSESISNELIYLVGKSMRTRLVLATRPQGIESISNILSSHGLTEKTKEIRVPNLDKKNTLLLAKEALGKSDDIYVKAKKLVDLSDSSPFLIIQAGTLISRGLLDWSQLIDEQSFRIAVLQCYEREYLNHFDGFDLEPYKRYLRLLSLLSPVGLNRSFYQCSSDFLGLKKYETEKLSKRLQNAGMLSEGVHNVRVIPDLYSDFLTFQIGYDPDCSLPTFITEAHERFPEAVGAILRNLSEASWIAERQGIDSSHVITPLFKKILEVFENSSFQKRTGILAHWANFSVFLPKESLILARNAMRLKDAPERIDEDNLLLWDEPDYQTVRREIPTILKPIAKYHLETKSEALDLLWELGKTVSLSSILEDSGHPWAVITDAIKYEPNKSINNIVKAIDWVGSLVRRSDAQRAMYERKKVLSILLRGCFDRTVDFDEWHGHMLKSWWQPVDISITRVIRDRALEIVRWVIENLKWNASLEALDVLAHAMRRYGPRVTSQRNQDIALWRPERIKALEIINLLTKKHPHVLIRHSVRQLILSDLTFEEDSQFETELRKVLADLKDDFELRFTTVVNSKGGWEFERKRGEASSSQEISYEEQLRLWSQRVDKVACGIIHRYPNPADAARMIAVSANTSLDNGFAPHHGGLFESLVKIDECYARRMCQYFLTQTDPRCTVQDWFYLLVSLSKMNSEPVNDILEIALNSEVEINQIGMIRYFSLRDRDEFQLTSQDRLVIESILKNANSATIANYISLVGWLGDENARWGMRMLTQLSSKGILAENFNQILEAFFPDEKQHTSPDQDVIKKLLSSAIDIDELSIYKSKDRWSQLTNEFPFDVYCFFVDRIKYKQSHPEKKNYRAIPVTDWDAINFENLSKIRNFGEILQILWEKSSRSEISEGLYDWCELFHKIVIPKPDFWKPKLLQKISDAVTMDDLYRLRGLISFDGSLVVFRMVDVTRSFLEKSRSVGREEGLKEMISWLYVGAGPQIRSYSSGNLSSDSDYVESEARKSFMEHKNDELLENFFLSIIDFERSERERDLSLSYFDDE